MKIEKKYNVFIKKDAPIITIKIPSCILRDLVLRSEENGHSVDLELAIRLARSLERDLKMFAQDEAQCCAAFDTVLSKLK